jgi:hypothetical protein
LRGRIFCGKPEATFPENAQSSHNIGTFKTNAGFQRSFRGLLLEHELFRKPVSTFRDHAPADYRSRRWELGWGTFAPFPHYLWRWNPPSITQGARWLPRLLQAGGIDSRTDERCGLSA